jgi:response regulator of citrate/malate metabolism
LKRIAQFELVGICNNALEAKEILNSQPVDLIFLDIQLPGMNGLSFLKTLQDPPA